MCYNRKDDMESFANKAFIENAVSRYSDMIIRIAFNFVKNRADAEDIMQEAFMALIKKAPIFNEEEHLKAWLIRVAVNKSKNRLKAAKQRRECALSAADGPYTDAYSEVFDEIMKLPEADRATVYLFYIEGYSAKEIAKLLGKTKNSVFMRLTRAREKLKQFLEVKES